MKAGIANRQVKWNAIYLIEEPMGLDKSPIMNHTLQRTIIPAHAMVKRPAHFEETANPNAMLAASNDLFALHEFGK